MTSEDARTLFAQALARAGERDTLGSIELAERAIAIEPAYAEALEHVGQLLVTRRRRYAEGLAYMERAAAARPDDAGLWYSLGWCCEFAAHELARRGDGDDAMDPRALYERAAEAFRRCLDLHPEGKLQGDAEDLLDHVENELLSF